MVSNEYRRGFSDGYADLSLENPNDDYYLGYIDGQLKAESDLGKN